jgi:hypothetical protein
MIRFFTALCKSVLEKFSDEVIFQKATDGFRYYNEQCPSCGAAGKLSPYGDYFRYLVSHDGEKIIEFSVNPLRFECVSCGKTHALLPDIIIPYSPYSLRFKLTALVAYFERSKTVAAVCEQFGIAVTTLYMWKHRLLEHKDLLLGILESHKEPVQTFLRGLFASIQLSDKLRDFFRRYAFSFMQNQFIAATRSQPP